MQSDAKVMEDFIRLCRATFEGKAACVIDARAVEFPDPGTIYERISFHVVPTEDHTIQNGQLKGVVLVKGQAMRGGKMGLIYHSATGHGQWEKSKAYIEKPPAGSPN
jgi:hypothetical protein